MGAGAQSDNGLVECPACGGDGMVSEDCRPVICDVCHGRGGVTQHEYEQWEQDVVDVYQAERDYIRSLAD